MYSDPSGNFAISLSTLAVGLLAILVIFLIARIVEEAPEIANAINSLINEITSNNGKKEYTVYGLEDDNGNILYVGRTKNPSQRESYHRTTRAGLKFTRLEDDLTYNEARGLEQYYITKFRTLRPKIYPYNQINGISKFNKQIDVYAAAAIFTLADRAENEILNLLGW